MKRRRANLLHFSRARACVCVCAEDSFRIICTSGNAYLGVEERVTRVQICTTRRTKYTYILYISAQLSLRPKYPGLRFNCTVIPPRIFPYTYLRARARYSSAYELNVPFIFAAAGFIRRNCWRARAAAGARGLVLRHLQRGKTGRCKGFESYWKINCPLSGGLYYTFYHRGFSRPLTDASAINFSVGD